MARPEKAPRQAWPSFLSYQVTRLTTGEIGYKRQALAIHNDKIPEKRLAGIACSFEPSDHDKRDWPQKASMLTLFTIAEYQRKTCPAAITRHLRAAH
jgi:hypothetical protein